MNLRRTHLGHGHTARGLVARAGQGFTLLETLVAIGAVALVAVGLAAIFDSVGKTVTGGRRASRLTSFASIIEGQFRKDFDGMIRDKGVLVIRQNAVQLSGGTEFRRADEITFFARGDFKSVRPPIHSARVPTSDTALIYYGHGVKQTPNYAAGLTNTYLYPSVAPYESTNRPLSVLAPDRLGAQANHPVFFGSGTNEKVSDWTLLRHATLLVKPQKDVNATGANGQRPSEDTALVIDQLGLNAGNSGRIVDAATQFELQPAAPSIFRNLGRAMNRSPARERFAPSVGLIRERLAGEGVPSRSSGIVDVAMGDLDDVRSFIETGLANPAQAAQPFGLIPSQSGLVLREPTFLTDLVLRPFGRFDLATIPVQNGRRTVFNTTFYNAVDRMHAWMNDLFPAQSDANDGYYGNTDLYESAFLPSGAPKEPEGERMRYEASGPGLLDVTDPNNPDLGPYATDAPMLRSLYGDQIAVGSSTFLPRCTNFIVEWSFGEVVEQDITHNGGGILHAGEMLWYGPERRTSSTSGAVTTFDVLHAVPYPVRDSSNNPVRGFLQPFPLRKGGGAQRFYEVSDFLIYGMPAGVITTQVGTSGITFQGPVSLTSYFGYVDPTFDASWPERTQGGGSRVWEYDATGNLVNVLPVAGRNGDDDRDGDKANDATDSAVSSMPWAWPKLIRVTVTLADPREKNVEETFQYVFRVPERGP